MPFTAGIDIGASATKAAILAGQDPAQAELIGAAVLRSGVDFALSARQAFEAALAEAGIEAGQVQQVFSCGYGRDNVGFAHQTRTEIAAHGAAAFRHFPRALTVLDIGGQDNKVIELDPRGGRRSFSMNRKCAAGTGSFLEEIALRLRVPIEELGEMARRSLDPTVAIGSYCTVFAMTEILAQIRKGVRAEDLARAALVSVGRRVLEAHAFPRAPIVATGGVVAHQPLLRDILAETLKLEVLVPPHPQHIGALGAALFAAKHAPEE